MKRAGIVVYLAVTSSLLPMPPADAAPQPTFVTCDFPVTTSIKLRNSLFGCPVHGLRVLADNVTIDLNGHIVDGNDVDDVIGEPEAGIDSEGKVGLVVKNGTFRDFEYGADMTFGDGRFGNVVAVSNDRGFNLLALQTQTWTLQGNTAADNAESGFSLGEGNGVFLRNEASGNGATGFSMDLGRGRAHDNRAIGNGGRGFSLQRGSSIRRNRATGNGDDGFLSAGAGPTTLAGNVSTANRGDGYEITSPARTLEENKALGNSGVGFRISSGADHRLVRNVAKGSSADGFLLTGTSEVTMKRNRALENRGDGIQVDVDTLKIVENKAHRNGFDNGDDDGSGLGIRDAGSTSVAARRNRADGNADATECSATMRCS